MPAARVPNSQTFSATIQHHNGGLTPPTTSPARINNSDGLRPRTLSSPVNVTTPPSCRVRIPRRPSSPGNSTAHSRRTIGLSAREQRLANECRAATHESEQCRAELMKQGIQVRDFQAELDLEVLRRVAESAGRKGPWPDQERRRPQSEEDEVVMKGRHAQ